MNRFKKEKGMKYEHYQEYQIKKEEAEKKAEEDRIKAEEEEKIRVEKAEKEALVEERWKSVRFIVWGLYILAVILVRNGIVDGSFKGIIIGVLVFALGFIISAFFSPEVPVTAPQQKTRKDDAEDDLPKSGYYEFEVEPSDGIGKYMRRNGNYDLTKKEIRKENYAVVITGERVYVSEAHFSSRFEKMEFSANMVWVKTDFFDGIGFYYKPEDKEAILRCEKKMKKTGGVAYITAQGGSYKIFSKDGSCYIGEPQKTTASLIFHI